MTWLEIVTKEWDQLHERKKKLEKELKATEKKIEKLKNRIRRDLQSSRKSK